MRETMLNKLKEFPENLRTSVGLVSLIIIIFLHFSFLIFFMDQIKIQN